LTTSARINKQRAKRDVKEERNDHMAALWKERISVNPMLCHGKACIKGTRVLVSAVLDNLAEGVPEQEILKNYPSITHEDILATVAYAAELARERVVYLDAA
jgi:uncharacterized protein (DUF433 family)